MSQDHLVKLACKTCRRINYVTTRNRKRVEKKLALKKHCEWCRKHVEHTEAKK